MADVLIFRASSDTEQVGIIKNLLENEFPSLNFWWDADPYDNTWEAAVKKELSDARSVVVFWSKAALEPDCLVNSEINLTLDISKRQKRKIKIHNVKLEDEPLPATVSGQECSDFFKSWNGDRNDPHFQNLIQRIRIVFPHADQRLNALQIGPKEMTLPSFVRSVSSHETPIDPFYALNVLNGHPSTEPVLLSAYDVHVAMRDGDKARLKSLSESLEGFKHKGAPVILDSGNYEAFRHGVSHDKASRRLMLNNKISKEAKWSHKQFKEVVKTFPFDIVLSFDPTDLPDENKARAEKTIKRFEKDFKFIKKSGSQAAPILHPLPHKNTDLFVKNLGRLIIDIFNKFQIPFVAIPERELGNGIIQRAEIIKKLRGYLRDNEDTYIPIHILGTGHPLTISILSLAGADIFDGLEWCRTAIDRSSDHLTHHQHFDFLSDQTIEKTDYAEVKSTLSTPMNIGNPKLEYYLPMFMHNVDYFDDLMNRLRYWLSQGKVMNEMLDGRIPDSGLKKLRSILSEEPQK